MENEHKIYNHDDLAGIKGDPDKVWSWKDSMEALAKSNPDKALEEYQKSPEWWNYNGIRDAAEKTNNTELKERLDALRSKIMEKNLRIQDEKIYGIKSPEPEENAPN